MLYLSVGKKNQTKQINVCICSTLKHPKFSYGSFADRSHPQLSATNSGSSYATITAATVTTISTEVYSMAFAANDFRLAQISICVYLYILYGKHESRYIEKCLFYHKAMGYIVCLFSISNMTERERGRKISNNMSKERKGKRKRTKQIKGAHFRPIQSFVFISIKCNDYSISYFKWSRRKTWMHGFENHVVSNPKW